MEVTASENVTEVMFELFINAYIPIDVTDDGTNIAVSAELDIQEINVLPFNDNKTDPLAPLYNPPKSFKDKQPANGF
ncbi:MAG: hypothetical protein MJZ68_08625 [archaeon]|nr:hypothetical protein [archaeon]